MACVPSNDDPSWTSETILDMPLGSHIAAPVTNDEAERMKALRDLEILDTEVRPEAFHF